MAKKNFIGYLLNEYMNDFYKSHATNSATDDIIKKGIAEQVKSEIKANRYNTNNNSVVVIGKGKVFRSKEKPWPSKHFGTVQNPVNMMELEHEQVGENFKEIRRLTHDYSLPESACGSYIFLYRMLEEFEEDLHLHIHLENNILFPKALEIEKTTDMLTIK